MTLFENMVLEYVGMGTGAEHEKGKPVFILLPYHNPITVATTQMAFPTVSIVA